MHLYDDRHCIKMNDHIKIYFLVITITYVDHSNVG